MYLIRTKFLADHDRKMIENFSPLGEPFFGFLRVQGPVGDTRGKVVPLLDGVGLERSILKIYELLILNACAISTLRVSGKYNLI